MSYFLPSSVKSRLLRFALAKTGFLDTDALDLDKLNFSIGRNTSAEFRDVGLRLEVCASPPLPFVLCSLCSSISSGYSVTMALIVL
jgi:hypothetical protein